jgi:tripartite ATP-independent transporter DctM subunit
MIKKILHRVENVLAVLSLLVMAFLPTVDLLLRNTIGTTISGSSSFVQNLTLWVTFVGAMLASRTNGHLTLSAADTPLHKKLSKITQPFSGVVSVAVSSGLFWASFLLVRAEYEGGVLMAGWLPLWIVEAIMPLAFAVMTIRFAISQPEGLRNRLISSMGIPLAALIGFPLLPFIDYLFIPVFVTLIFSALAGVPIFIVLGGLALLLFFHDGVPVASIPVETYRIVASPTIPAIPLFTLAGYMLAEGNASKRLVRLFNALFGWLPGGPAVATILVCTFFTTFTGASGVTILALGGILLPVLLQCGYKKDFSIGLIASAGSLGLLFPPSLPLILYGVFSHTSIVELFKVGLLPGAFMVTAVAVYAIYKSKKEGLTLGSPSGRAASSSLWYAKWDMGLPVVIIFGIFGGYCTIVEAAALSAVYAIFVECIVHREMSIFKQLPATLLKCATTVGGVMVIVGVAMGLAGYLVDAEIPARITELAKEHIKSRWAFLLFLNLFLIVVGCLMDIFSALVVVVPLVIPIGNAFGIDPVHLGIIFIANLELGYLTPPVGMNLFFSSYRFGEPLTRVYRYALPFLILLLATVLVITYAPLLFLY